MKILFNILIICTFCVQSAFTAEISQQYNYSSEPNSAGTFTIENFSDRDLNISLYNLENNGTYSFADVPLGTTPDFFTGTDSTIETTVIQNCSVGYNQNLFRFRANPGMGEYITVATLPNQKFPINRIEFLFRWDGSTGWTLGLSLSNTGLFYFNHVQFAFQNDNWINHGLTLTNWNKISLIDTGGTWQLWLNDILKYTRAYTINNRTELTLKLHVASGAVSDYLYIDTIDIGSESTKQNFIDQKISADQIPTTNYWNDRIPAYSNILVHKDSDKYISTTQNDYYIVNRDFSTNNEIYEITQGSSYIFNPPELQLLSESSKITEWDIQEKFLANTFTPSFKTNISHVIPKEHFILVYIFPNITFTQENRTSFTYLGAPWDLWDLYEFSYSKISHFQFPGDDRLRITYSYLNFDHSGILAELILYGRLWSTIGNAELKKIYFYEYTNPFQDGLTWNKYLASNESENLIATYSFNDVHFHGHKNFTINSHNKSFIIKTSEVDNLKCIFNSSKSFARILNNTIVNSTKYYCPENVSMTKTLTGLKKSQLIEFTLTSNNTNGTIKIGDHEYELEQNTQKFQYVLDEDLTELKISLNLSVQSFTELSISNINIFDKKPTKTLYLNPFGSIKTYLKKGSYFAFIYENSELKEIKDFTFYSAISLCYSLNSKIESKLYLIDNSNNYIDHNCFTINVRYQINNINQTRRLLSDIIFVDQGSTLDILIYDRIFQQLVYNSTMNAAELIVIQLEMFTLKVRSELTETREIKINETRFVIYPNENIEFQLPRSEYEIKYLNEQGENMNEYVLLNQSVAVILKSALRVIYFSLFDSSGLGLDTNTVRFYINRTITEFRKQELFGTSAHLLVLDYFNATIYNQTVSIVNINEFNIYVPVYTLSLFNNYTDPVKFTIKRSDLEFNQLEQQLAPQSTLHFRFLANEKYLIEIRLLNGTLLETREVDLIDNRYLSFGFYSAEISKEDLKTTLNDLLFLISIVLGLAAVFLVSFIYSYAKLTKRDAVVVKKIKKTTKIGRDDRDFLGGF